MKKFTTVLLCLFINNQISIAKTNKKDIPKEDPNISMIKNGVLNFDNSITLGMAIDNYKYCNHVQWKSFKSDNGRNLVSAYCDYKIYNKKDIEDSYKNIGFNQEEKDIYEIKKQTAIKQRAWDTLNFNYGSYPIVKATIGEKIKIQDYPEKLVKQGLEFIFVINYDNTFSFYSYGVNNLIQKQDGTMKSSSTDLSMYLNSHIINLYKNERLW